MCQFFLLRALLLHFFFFFFFNDTATTEIYTLSLHDALPISKTSRTRGIPVFRWLRHPGQRQARREPGAPRLASKTWHPSSPRSEEHTSELQSQSNIVCRLLLEKKKPTERLIYVAQPGRAQVN